MPNLYESQAARRKPSQGRPCWTGLGWVLWHITRRSSTGSKLHPPTRVVHSPPVPSLGRGARHPGDAFLTQFLSEPSLHEGKEGCSWIHQVGHARALTPPVRACEAIFRAVRGLWHRVLEPWIAVPFRNRHSSARRRERGGHMSHIAARVTTIVGIALVHQRAQLESYLPHQVRVDGGELL